MSALNVVNSELKTQNSEKPIRPVRVGLLGYGRIGQAVAALAEAEEERLASAGIELECTGALVRDIAKPRTGPALALSNSSPDIVEADVDVVVEVLGGIEPAHSLVAKVLRSGRPVVSANKTLVATCGQELKALADAHGTVFACDAAVLAGVPFIGSLSRRPLISAAVRIEGIVNGTSHYIVDAVGRGIDFNAAVKEAIARGYAEPDSSADTSGRDAAEKLTILLHLAGCHDVKVSDLTCTSLGVLQPEDLRGAWNLGGTIKPVAIASLDANAAGAWVGPAFVANRHAFAPLAGVANALCLTGRNGHTVTFSGPGAGPDATAVTLVDDIVEAVTGQWTQRAAPRPVESSVPASLLRQPARGPWFLSLGDHERAEWPAEALEVLSSRGIRVTHTAVGGEQARPVHVITASASWQAIQDAIWAFHARGTRVLALPAIGIS